MGKPNINYQNDRDRERVANKRVYKKIEEEATYALNQLEQEFETLEKTMRSYFRGGSSAGFGAREREKMKADFARLRRDAEAAKVKFQNSYRSAKFHDIHKERMREAWNWRSMDKALDRMEEIATKAANFMLA